MTTSPGRYADLMAEHDDPAQELVVDALHHALPTLAAPSVADKRVTGRMLSRKAALQAGAATAGAATAGAAWLSSLGHTNAALVAEVAGFGQEGPMSAARLGGILRDERAWWYALLAEVGPGRMDVAGVEGTWSVKQIVGHLTWYEGVIVEGARKLMNTGTFVREGLRALPLDERNVLLAVQSAARPVQEILAESERVFGQLLAVIASCPDDILTDPRRLGLPDDVVPWTLVANNSYAHYREHAQAIRAWLDLSSPSVAGAVGTSEYGETTSSW